MWLEVEVFEIERWHNDGYRSKGCRAKMSPLFV